MLRVQHDEKEQGWHLVPHLWILRDQRQVAVPLSWLVVVLGEEKPVGVLHHTVAEILAMTLLLLGVLLPLLTLKVLEAEAAVGVDLDLEVEEDQKAVEVEILVVLVVVVDALAVQVAQAD